MMFSRSLQFPAVLLFGTTLAIPAAFAQAPTARVPAASQSMPEPAGGQVVEDIVARVNDQIISQSDYDRSLQQLDAEGREQGLTPGQIENRKRDLLRDLIDQQLLLSKGKELGITGEAELVRRLDEIRKQNHLDSMEDLEKAAAAQGVSYEDFKANIRNSIITQQVVQQEVSRRVSMSPSEVQAYYKAHQAEFSQPESVHLSEILIPTQANADASQVAAAQAKADDVEAKLKGGAKFDDLAKSASSGPTAAQGGELGEFKRGMLAPQLEQQTFSLSAGQYTGPIRTKQGFVILQVTHHALGGDAGFKDVQPQVEEALFMQRMQPALRQYLSKLRDAAYIDIKPGFADSAASTNELQLTYSSYQPPAAKKTQHFTRTRYHANKPAATTHSTQSVAKAAPATAPATTAATASTAQAATATPPATQQAKSTAPSTEKPGKREKVRFGQAPRESLPANDQASGSQQASVASTTTPNSSSPSSDVRDLSPTTPIGAETQEPTEGKTRLSQRPVVHKTKEQKAAEAAQDPNNPAPPSEKEVADQKVQSAPLGLTDQTQTKKKKEKGEKTRYAERPKQPEQVQQPYGAPQPGQAPPANPPGGTQPQQPAGSQPATPNANPQ